MTSSGGKHHLATHPFSRPQPSLSLTNILPSLWSSPAGLVPVQGHANAVTLGASKSTGTDVWVLVEMRLQKWNMSTEGWEEAISDDDVGSIIQSALRAGLPSVPSDDGALDLELLDFAFEKHSLTNGETGRMVILVSYAGQEEEMAVTAPRRVFALVWLTYGFDKYNVERVSSVPYQSVRVYYCANFPCHSTHYSSYRHRHQVSHCILDYK